MKYLVIFLISFSAHAGYNPKAFEFKCKDSGKVAKEAIAYSLVGAWEPYADHKCFSGQKFQFFNPSVAQPEGDVIDGSKLIQFKLKRDKYAIENVKKDGDNYLISVKFKIDNKMISTVYRYVPDAEYTGRTGICGFVTNPTHKIVRSDCINQNLRKKLLK